MIFAVEEIWRPMPCYTSPRFVYEVSNMGRIRRSIPGGGTRLVRGSRRSNLPHRDYLCVSFRKSSKYRFPIHRLVALAFLGDIPAGFEVDHINGDRQDNRVCNLRIVTRRENHQNRRACANSQNKNIHRRRDSGAFQVYVDHKYVGTFENLEAAKVAAKRAREMAGYIDSFQA